MFVNLLLQALSGAATAEVSHLLEKFRELNGEEKYRQLVTALRNSFLLLQDVVDDTKTKVDDTLVGIILNALPQVAAFEFVAGTGTGSGDTSTNANTAPVGMEGATMKH